MSASSKRSQKRAAPQIDRSDIKRVRDADDDEEKDEEFGDMGDAEDFGEEEINQVADSTSLSIQDLVSFSKEWQRAECPPQDTNEDFIFQQIEIDVCSGKPHSTMAKGTDPNEAPHIRLFGVTKEGYSVMTRVHGFMPYFYADCPPISIAKQVRVLLFIFSNVISHSLKARTPCNWDNSVRRFSPYDQKVRVSSV